MKGQTRGAPLEARSACSNCGRKGLGNTYHATSAGAIKGRRPYRQCCYCQHIEWQDKAAIAAKKAAVAAGIAGDACKFEQL